MIVVIVVAAALIYYFFLKKKGGKTGDKCTSNTDCASQHYCGGDGTCHEGQAGRPSGSKCTDSEQCEYGLKCVSDKCTSSTPPPAGKLIPSFSNSQVVTEINGKRFYLVVGPPNPIGFDSQSKWLPDKPNISMSWSSSRLEAVVTGEVSGDVSINAIGALIEGAASKLFFIRQSDKTIVLEDDFSNRITSVKSNEDDEYGAFFIDPEQYPDQGGITGTPVTVSIIPDAT